MKKSIFLLFIVFFTGFLSVNFAQGLYPEGSQRLLNNNDLKNLSAEQLKIMRNEIYARHGYVFSADDLAEYFKKQAWYTPLNNNYQAVAALSTTENKNIALIKEYEAKLNGDVEEPENNADNYLKTGMFPFTSIRKITYNDVQGLSAWELKVMRNEIYARHGFVFQTDELKEYFAAQEWYKPLNNNVEAQKQLSPLEQENINFIRSYEQ